MITVTENAVKQLRELLATRPDRTPNMGLRLLVGKGGCAGMEYAMKLDSSQEGDHVFDQAGVSVIVDETSLAFLKGSVIDYEDSLNDSGFKVINPNAERSCGCGSSFEPKATA